MHLVQISEPCKRKIHVEICFITWNYGFSESFFLMLYKKMVTLYFLHGTVVLFAY